jgi:predicted phosphodiesterase
MRLQVHSDIHLERYPTRRIRPRSSILVLAGDIGVPIFPSYKQFFKDTSRDFDTILYVLGNHEYERTWMGIDKTDFSLLQEKFIERNKLIRDILSEMSNIYLLDNSEIKLKDKKIFGSTLWTNYHQRRSNKPLSTIEQFITHQHFTALPKIQVSQYDILITHFVSNRSVLKKPWSIGLGPSNIIHSGLSIFGHIHYRIQEKNVICNPWGEEKECRDIIIELD